MASTPLPRPGGRTARVTAAVYAAVVTELVERRYDDVSLESIADRAGVHKTTLYRRWGSKPALLLDALQSIARERVIVPDSGSFAQDLSLLARSVAETLASAEGTVVVRLIASQAAAGTELHDWIEKLWRGRADVVGVIVERAVSRGEIPAGTGPVSTMNALAAPIYYRLLVSGQRPRRADADLAADAALAAVMAGVFVGTS